MYLSILWRRRSKFITRLTLGVAAALSVVLCGASGNGPCLAEQARWVPAGWGGGGFYWCAAFDPTRENTIYMGGDVDGVYRTDDLGAHWRLVNNGLTSYGVYGLSISPIHPDTVYADTTTGLNKTTDGGAHWSLLPGAKAAGIKGVRNATIRPIAIDPFDDRTIFAGTGTGKIYKSGDAGETWRNVYSTSGPIHSVCVSPNSSLIVVASTDRTGLIISHDGGSTWMQLPTPAKASSCAFVTGDPNALYATFYQNGIYRSVDGGSTWRALSVKGRMVEVVVNPKNPLDVYAIDAQGWNGKFWSSHDGGATWKAVENVRYDRDADPTNAAEEQGTMSWLTNLTVSPVNPKLIFLSGNWRPSLSKDSGATWVEADRGADISVVYDIRFNGAEPYVGVMDEGVLKSDDEGANWTKLWPLPNNGAAVGGHYWRLAVWNDSSSTHVLSTCSPWDNSLHNRVVLSTDGGKTYRACMTGLPDYNPRANTMWGQGYMRALAQDPNNPSVLYAGIDGDPSDGNAGGGIFKSTDGGVTWSRLASQPVSRRMFFGLVVDPTDSQRIYWAACGDKGGVYRSDDGGDSWKLVFSKENWIFNLAISRTGIVYAPGYNLWKSTDHGDTWRQISNFQDGCQIIGLALSSADDNTVWISELTWTESSAGFVRKTIDGGATWTDITGDIPYRKPMILRYNSQTHELWAGGVGLWKLKQ